MQGVILGRMSDESPGRALRAALDGTLPPNMQWTAQELATLDSVEAAADRLAALRARFAVLVADPEATEARLASLQTALHQIEGDLFRWIKSLNPTVVTAVSRQHQQAALIRWHGANSGA
jgi:hypothetical protein